MPTLSFEQAEAVQLHLREVIESSVFSGSQRSKDFLILIVGHALAGRWDDLRERVIGSKLFGRPIDYDTANDAIIRVQAIEVRKKLSRYYSEQTSTPIVRIMFPSGSYVPQFVWSTPESLADATSDTVNISDPLSPTESVRDTRSPDWATRFYFTVRTWVILSSLIVSAVGFYCAFRFWVRRADASPRIHSIAILPLDDLSGNPQQDYLAEGLTDELIADLGEISALSVVSRTSTMTYRGTKKTLPVIVRELGVDAVVTGSVEREGDRVRISAQLIDARSDRSIWSHSYIRELSSVLPMQGEVAREIADAVFVKVKANELTRLTQVRRMDPVAQEQYLIGTHFLTVSDPMAAIDSFKRALSIDSNIAQFHAALANTYGWVGDAGWMPYSTAFHLEKMEAERAIELDDNLPDGHAALANAVMNLDWDWKTQDVELRRALLLNPSSASVRWFYANFLERIGHVDEAIAESALALQLDPISSRAYTSSALVFYFARNYSDALEQLKKARLLPHKSDEMVYPLAVIYVEQGRYKEAIAEFQKLGSAAHAIGHLGNLYARMGDTAKSEQMIQQLSRRIAQTNVGRYEVALIYIGLGRNAEAFSVLEQALAVHDKGLIFLKIDPCLDAIRSDARFKSLEKRVGLDK